jgi:hypothetical protein
MMTDTQIKNRRDDILEAMRSIRRMKRGQISEQTLCRTGAGGTVNDRGPYAIFQRWEKGRNRCRRVPAAELPLPALKVAVAGYLHSKALAEEFATLTETLTERSGALLPAKKTPGGFLFVTVRSARTDQGRSSRSRPRGP